MFDSSKACLVRAFFAVDIGPDVRRAAADWIERVGRSRFPQLRWAAAESLHVTLQFLGEVAAPQIHRLKAGLAEVARSEPPFSVRVGRLGGFPSPGKARVLWLGLREGEEALARLASRLRKVALECACPLDDKPFRAHLTVARAGEGISVDARALETPESFGRCTVEKLLLMESRLSPGGARYRVEAACPLTGMETHGNV